MTTPRDDHTTEQTGAGRDDSHGQDGDGVTSTGDMTATSADSHRHDGTEDDGWLGPGETRRSRSRYEAFLEICAHWQGGSTGRRARPLMLVPTTSYSSPKPSTTRSSTTTDGSSPSTPKPACSPSTATNEPSGHYPEAPPSNPPQTTDRHPDHPGNDGEQTDPTPKT
jgi:hypothetical protein